MASQIGVKLANLANLASHGGRANIGTERHTSPCRKHHSPSRIARPPGANHRTAAAVSCSRLGHRTRRHEMLDTCLHLAVAEEGGSATEIIDAGTGPLTAKPRPRR